MKISIREDYRSCANCGESRFGVQFAVVIGDVVFSLCTKCMRLFRSRLRLAEKKLEHKEEHQTHATP